MGTVFTFTIPALIAVCQKPGCPICWLQQEAVERYLKSVFETHYHDTDFQALLRVCKGFCKEHGWMAFELGLGSAFGAAIIYHNLLMIANDDLQKMNRLSLLQPSGTKRSKLGLILHRKTAAIKDPPSRCPACMEQQEAAQAALEVFIFGLNDAALYAAFCESEGLCVPHLRHAAVIPINAEISKILFTINSDKLESLRKEISEFIRQNEQKTPKQIRDVRKKFWPQVVGVISGYGLMSKKKG